MLLLCRSAFRKASQEPSNSHFRLGRAGRSLDRRMAPLPILNNFSVETAVAHRPALPQWARCELLPGTVRQLTPLWPAVSFNVPVLAGFAINMVAAMDYKDTLNL